MNRPLFYMERGLKLIVVIPHGKQVFVVPHLGAWIEMALKQFSFSITSVAPARERGLKRSEIYDHGPHEVSLPAWERGLKHQL